MHESKRVVLASKFATKENWSRTNSEQDFVRARTCDLSMVVLCLLAFCALPSANRAQVPVYEVNARGKHHQVWCRVFGPH
jgi:hypothetical protein